MTFRAFVAMVKPSFAWYRHTVILADVLQKVADGLLSRVMIFCPPRHGKSEEVSRLFSAYYLYRHPERYVGINSYSADLAYTLSRAARENFKAAGGQTKSDADAVKQWETPESGGLWAAGVGGPITGKGFHLGIIDDPTKNAEDADSETLRAKERDWYSSTFYTRAEPGAAILIIQTRWNEQDLSGWLLSQEIDEDDAQPERWHIVCFPAIAEDAPQPFPATCSAEADFRAEGEPLCPERFPLARLRQISARVGGYFWDSLFQQRPSAKAGSFFKVGQIGIESAAPASLLHPAAPKCRAWDMAATEGGGDYTAGVLMARDPQSGLFWILDVRRGRWATDTRNREIVQAAALDSQQYGRQVRIHGPQDPGAAGKDAAAAFVRMLAGHSVKTEPVSGAKTLRADPFSAQVNAGNVRMVQADWNHVLLEELRAFPLGKFDDMVDAAADAFTELALMAPTFAPMLGGSRPSYAPVR